MIFLSRACWVMCAIFVLAALASLGPVFDPPSVMGVRASRMVMALPALNALGAALTMAVFAALLAWAMRLEEKVTALRESDIERRWREKEAERMRSPAASIPSVAERERTITKSAPPAEDGALPRNWRL